MRGGEAGCASVASEIAFIAEGEKVGLGPVTRELVPLLMQWLSDPHGSEDERPALSESFQAAWFEQASSPDRRTFVIYERAEARPVGVCALFDLDGVNRSAELGVTIGVASFRGRGLATEATRVCSAFGFRALNLHNVLIRAEADNVAAIAAFQRAGFRKIGVRRGATRKGGVLVDQVYLDATPSDWQVTPGPADPLKRVATGSHETLNSG